MFEVKSKLVLCCYMLCHFVVAYLAIKTNKDIWTYLFIFIVVALPSEPGH